MTDKRRKRIRTWAIVLAVLVVLWRIVFSERLMVVTYELTSEKLTVPVTLALITDLHESRYGDDQQQLVEALRQVKPDAVCLVGDIFDAQRDETPSWRLIEQIAEPYPCYYVTGNHEIHTGEADRYIASLEALGVTVLRGEGARIPLLGGEADIFGVDDPLEMTTEARLGQLDACAEALRPEVFSVLLSHRPNHIGDAASRGFDLVLSGHEHGGQWRIPGLLNGLYAPDEGFFPKYAGGLYRSGDTQMVVSRGLCKNLIPRMFNRPELVIVRITPAG